MGDDLAESSEPSTSVGFRKIKRKPRALRQGRVPDPVKKPDDDESDDDANINQKLVDIHQVQLLRKRRNGMTALECALGKRLADEFDEFEDDPLRMSSMALSEDKKMKLTAEDITSGIKEQFRKEELLFDEDEEMKKYITSNLRTNVFSEKKEGDESRFVSADDEILLKAAEKLRGFSSKKDDELLSNQMLAGIPEVDLGIDARMKNVLETEKLKGAMLANGGKPPKEEVKPKRKRFDPSRMRRE